MTQDLHFKYVNPIRKPNGKLRSWEEYDNLSRLENSLDLTSCKYTFIRERSLQVWKHKLVDLDFEKNS